MAHRSAPNTDDRSNASMERFGKLLDSEGRARRPSLFAWDAKGRRIVYLGETGAKQQPNLIVTHDDMQLD